MKIGIICSNLFEKGHRSTNTGQNPGSVNGANQCWIGTNSAGDCAGRTGTDNYNQLVSMRAPPLRKTWEYSNITQALS
jgi:hypothetical protein